MLRRGFAAVPGGPARRAVPRPASLIAAGQPCRRRAAPAKVVSTEALQGVAHHRMQIVAGAGHAAESDMRRILPDAALRTLGEGRNGMLRQPIARETGL